MAGAETRGDAAVLPSSAELAALSREEKLALLRRLTAGAAPGGAQEPTVSGEPGRHPVSFAQRRMWFLDRLEPGGSHSTIFRALRLRGPVDQGALTGALARITARHEALRTRFEEADGEPVQVVEPADVAGPQIARVDLSDLDPGERERHLSALARREAARPFDLARSPLARFTLATLGEDEAALLIALHHIVADGWSLGILLRELSTLYRAAVRGAGPGGAELPALPTTYGAYARRQRRRLSGDPLERELGFWRERLAGAPTVLDLPTDRPRPPMETFRGAIEPCRLGDAASAGVARLAREERSTAFMVLLAAFAGVLGRWAGRDDLLVGTPVAGRPESELEPLIGFFANTLVLRADLTGEPTFRELVQSVRAHTLPAFGHQEMPFERLVEELEQERDLSRNPLFQVMFALQNMPATRLELEGLAVEQLPVERGLAKVDLTLDLRQVPEEGERLIGYLEYNTDLFDRSTARRVVAGFERLVAAAVSDPDRPVSALPLLSAPEHHALVTEWQGTGWPGSGRGAGDAEAPPVHESIRRRAAAEPTRVAVEAGGDTWTYGELDRAAARVAARLGSLGVGAEDRVAVLAPRSVEAIAAFLGVLRAGAAYVPLDPEYPDERLAFMAGDARARALLVTPALEGRLAAVAPEGVPGVSLVPGELFGGGADGEAEAGQPSGPDSGDWKHRAAYVIYTSGTTGRPKGVVVSHGALANHAAAVAGAYDLVADDRVLQFASVSFDIAGEEIYPSLARGATLVLRTEELSLEPAGLNRFVAERDLTVVNIPTPLWHEWCREMEQGGDGVLPPERLRLVVVGTEGALPERLAAWSDALRRAGRRGPRWVNAYGPTEATITATVHSSRPCGPDRREVGAERVPIGRPIAGLTAHVLDGRLAPVPLGAVGELYLGGAGLARGYLGRPGATASVFVPDPFRTDPFGAARNGSAPDGVGGRLYRTGDLARVRPDGAVEFLGRADDQVKIRGFRVEPGEVESALAGHPQVREAAVLAVEAAPGDRRLVAYVAGGTGAKVPTVSALREWVGERLPAYMVPAAFVTLEALPLTPAGKVDRERLPEPDLRSGAGPHVPPRTPTEELLAEIWREVLGAERLGVHDDFFSLGGHSLLATRVISRVRDRLGVELPVRAVFEAPTVARMAEELASPPGDGTGGGRSAPALPPIVPVERGEATPGTEGPGEESPLRGPLSFAQQRLWFLDRLEPGRSIYNVPAAVRLETGGAPLDVEALEGALRAIVGRHGALRTTFERSTASGSTEGAEGAPAEPVQVVRPRASISLRRHDLTHLPPAAGRAEAARLGSLEASAPFDLERGPLVRFALLTLAATGEPERPADAALEPNADEKSGLEHRLLVTFHHTVADGWSIDVFLRELALLYDAGALGARPQRLAELPVQYVDYAAWQRSVLEGETLEGLLAFWRDSLAGAPQVIDLPSDRPRPPVPSYRGGRCYFRVAPELADSLAAVARDARASRFMTLLAAWQVLLARLCGVDDLLVGTPVAGRGRSELEGLVGLFVNTLVIRGRPEREAPFQAHLGGVREHLLDLFAHAELPFERLVEELRPDRSLAHNPLFQAMFSFQSSGLVAPDGSGGGGAGGGGLCPVLLSNYNDTARVDLALDLWEDRGGLSGYVEYAADLFDRTSARRLAERYVALLGAVAREPERPVGSLPLVSAAERHQAVVEWNATGRPLPEGATLHGLFRERVRATPDAEALVAGGERLTYEELGLRVACLGRHLADLGVGPETLVGLFVDRSAWMVVGLLGVLEAGGAYVPLDPSFPEERLSYMVEAADLRLLLTEGALVDRLPAAGGAGGAPGAPERTVLVLDREWPGIETGAPRGGGGSDRPALPEVSPEQLAYVIFTSGSTGKPKGVQIPHRAAVNFLRSMAREPGLGPEDTLLAVTTLSFDIALLELLLPLAVSGRVVVASSDETHAADELAARIAEVEPSVIQATPATWRMLLELPDGRFRLLPPPKKALCGGEALPRELADRLLDRGVELWNLYGPTETTVWSGALRMEPGDGPVPVGGPVDNTTLHVLDPLDPGAGPAPVGVAGELVIGGLGVARGYLGRPAMTAERFRPDSVSGPHSRGGARAYRTGDLVRRRPDGTLEFLGRLDHQVKVRGYRIELGEIESALARCPGVRQAAAVAREEGGTARLVAYVVAGESEDDAGIDTPALRTALEKSLPAYMVPSAFVLLEALPLTPNGKVDRGALPEPGDARPELAGGYVAPRTEVEEELAGIWKQVLGIERLGVTDNFFVLGGHSLSATQVMTRVEEAFGQEAPVRLLFEAPTIEGLAERLVERGLGQVDQEALERALDDIENLTEDELEALLGSGQAAQGAD